MLCSKHFSCALALSVGLSLGVFSIPANGQDTSASPAPSVTVDGPAFPGAPEAATGSGVIVPPSEPLANSPKPQVTLSQTPVPNDQGPPTAPTETQNLSGQLSGAVERAREFLTNGGPAIWAIAALSVITLAIILWKIWRFILLGAWSRRNSEKAVALWQSGNPDAALNVVKTRRGLRSRFSTATMMASQTLPAAAAREDATRVARELLAKASGGLRALELIATIAPLLGLLGTVLGMIAAFQALQEAGSRADPALLAGGIWEALLTTAAGMAVAIPASVALTWFEAVIDRIRQDMESLATRIFVHEASKLGAATEETAQTDKPTRALAAQ